MLKSVEPGGAGRLPFIGGDGGAQPSVMPTAAKAKPGRKSGYGFGRFRVSMGSFSAILCIALPTALAAFYFAVIAADQYAVEVRFAVRGSSGQTSTDVLGVVTGIASSGSAAADSYIVMDFIHSREIIEKMAGRLNIREIYSPDKGDIIASFDPDETVEALVKYIKKMIRVNFDTSSQVISVEARAFTAEDAKNIASTVIALSEDLTNQLSSRARQDAVKYAETEVKRTEDRLRANRVSLRTFRQDQQEFDPTKKAEASLLMLGKLDEELTNAKAKRAGLRRFMGDTAPSMRVLESQIKALESQLIEERAKIGQTETKDGASPLSNLVSDYEELAVEREFAEKAYVSALASLERARFEADQQQRYLATFVTPSMPQEALYPERVLNTVMVLGVSAILWALGLLIVYGVRDHAS
ncbi:MAG: lipopolysaccharide biosynthesis protein [Hyphomicrobiales bacterium]|nr:lipopolysaccharide biosynthesis protein [Hyphomicrobiales bacterium]